ncbi:PAS domain-containing protein [Sphingomonas arenae]|uniref:PAS domain-containing protein n=1 Tax=Sphingomonas arenae TaxID=2812555 RepID=UPI001F3D3FA3|nr:PAS domain-containing protein [Sphingomonas arenae]
MSLSIGEKAADAPDFLTSGGAMGALMRSWDWSNSPLGAPEAWPQSLRSVVGLLLGSKFPMFVAWGDELGFLYNDSYAEILGIKHPQALGRPFREIWGEIWEDISPLVDAAMAGEATYRENLPLLMNRKGFDEPTWFTFSYSPVRDESGKVAGMFCACTETTQAVLAERRKAEERERLARMFEQAPGFITILTGPEHVFEFANATYRRLFGDRNYVGRSVRETFPDLADQEFFGILDRVYQTGERFVASRIPVRLARQSGRGWDERHVDLIYEPITDETGKVTGIFVEGYDVTEQYRAEAELRESEARLRALTDNLPAGMVYQIATGPDGTDRRFLYVSQSHEKLTGVPASAVIENPSIPYELILPEDREELVLAEAEAIREGSQFDVSVRFRRTDGETRWCRILSAPRKQPNGSLIWDGIQIDTTEQKTTEAAFRDLNQTLEKRVAERTQELEKAHEQLRQSQKLEAMGALTGGVAHDFNNLLSPIVGSLDLLQRRNVGGERERRLINGALQSAERARVLVQRLLAFARRQPLQPRSVDVGALVSGMADLIASTTGPQIRVVVEVADSLPAAFADPNQLEMAILNLSVNARDAMPEGGSLRISAHTETVAEGNRERIQPGQYIRLSVADTGIGMDEATCKRAVEPFFSTKGIGRGTGLGLSMVHGLASQLGGALTIESQPGLGTNVEMFLPATTADAEQTPDPNLAASVVTANGTALLVDDEDLVRASTADMLTDLGYEVVEAASAEEALRLVENGQSADLLVTDHLMPGMTGTALARELRTRWEDLRVLLVSGYAEAEGIAPDLVRLVKPFRQADLAAKLVELEELEG